MTQQSSKNGLFLEKGEIKDTTPPKANSAIKSLTLFLIGAVYGLLILLILHFGVQGDNVIMLVSVYLYGILGGYGVILLKKSYTQADRGRRILMEVLEKSSEAHILVTPEKTTLHANPSFRKLVKAKIATPTLEDFALVFDNSDDILEKLDTVRAKAAHEGNSTIELAAVSEGLTQWFHITCQFFLGQVGYIHWRFDDISHRHRMETLIHEEREKLRDFTDNAPVGFFSVDENGRFRFANETFLKLVGTDRNTLMNEKHMHDFLAEAPANAAPYMIFKDDKTHQYGDILMQANDGHRFHAAVTHSIARNRDDTLITRSIVYDLTSEQKMKQALRASEDRFHRLFEEAPVGICILSAEGIISHANQTLSMMLGLPQDALNDHPLTNFIPDAHRHMVQNWIREMTSESGREVHLDVPMTGQTEIFVQIYARKIKVENSFVLHFIDLTEQKNLEQKFTQSQKMQAIGQLAGGVAHDFNNLLTAMIGFCDLLLLRHKPGDPSFTDIMQIQQNANRAANLVRQLLAFSRQQTLQARVLDLTDVLTELSHLLRRLIGANIELSLVHAANLGLVRADQGQMEQVFINLAVNARDAMPDGGKLIVRTQNAHIAAPKKLAGDVLLPPGEWVAVEVEDSGTGIPLDILDRIFEPFFSTKEVGAGTGLGLATVHGIVHQTGGFIDVESAESAGTTFTIYLPACQDTEDEKTETVDDKKPEADLTGSSSILLVEDEDAVRTFSARALSNKGYKVMDAPSGESALQLLEEGKSVPDILITDVMMPEMDGTALAKIVRAQYPHIKIIFISGYAEDRYKEHLGEGVWFLPKPFTLKQLATKVKEVVEDNS